MKVQLLANKTLHMTPSPLGTGGYLVLALVSTIVLWGLAVWMLSGVYKNIQNGWSWRWRRSLAGVVLSVACVALWVGAQSQLLRDPCEVIFDIERQVLTQPCLENRRTPVDELTLVVHARVDSDDLYHHHFRELRLMRGDEKIRLGREYVGRTGLGRDPVPERSLAHLLCDQLADASRIPRGRGCPDLP